MSITLETPVVIPPIEQKTFDEVWLYELKVNAPAGDSCRVEATVCPARTLADGSKELLMDQRRLMIVANLFADITAEEASTMYAIVQLVKARAGV